MFLFALKFLITYCVIIVSLGAPFVRPCATSKRKLQSFVNYYRAIVAKKSIKYTCIRK